MGLDCWRTFSFSFSAGIPALVLWCLLTPYLSSQPPVKENDCPSWAWFRWRYLPVKIEFSSPPSQDVKLHWRENLMRSNDFLSYATSQGLICIRLIGLLNWIIIRSNGTLSLKCIEITFVLALYLMCQIPVVFKDSQDLLWDNIRNNIVKRNHLIHHNVPTALSLQTTLIFDWQNAVVNMYC